MSVRPSFFIRIGTSPVLQHHFTGVRTVSPTAGLDRVPENGIIHISLMKNWVGHYFFSEKRGLIVYLAVLKKGAIRAAHPYYVIYR